MHPSTRKVRIHRGISLDAPYRPRISLVKFAEERNLPLEEFRRRVRNRRRKMAGRETPAETALAIANRMEFLGYGETLGV